MCGFLWAVLAQGLERLRESPMCLLLLLLALVMACLTLLHKRRPVAAVVGRATQWRRLLLAVMGRPVVTVG